MCIRDGVGELPVLYYQSQDGRDVPVSDLASFAAENIPERAAIPKDFIRLIALPLTTVGKINKLALTMLEAERTLRAAAEATGAVITQLTVEQDPKRGVVARATVTAGLAELEKALSAHALEVDLKPSPI